jgi:First Longin domain of INTU, CCZ1 and HPS4
MDALDPTNLPPTQLSLFSLFVFNGKFAGKREEDDYLKILYFWPPTASLDQQGKQVGLAEALTMFSKYVFLYLRVTRCARFAR